MSKHYFGIDLGGTNIKMGIFDSQMNLLANTSEPTFAEYGPEAVLDRIAAAAEKLLAQTGFTWNDVSGIGIGAPGPADFTAGVIIFAPNLPAFRNVPLRQMVRDRFNKPTILENDANAACYGEYVIGAGKGTTDMVFLTLGTGIGGGIVTQGVLIHGFMDNAAELGHMIIEMDGRLCGCGQRGCVEAYASANSTVKRTIEAINAGRQSSLAAIYKETGKLTAKDIYTESAKGDELAKEITEGTAKALGIFCVSLLHVTGPRRIVFAGGMIAAGDALLSRIRFYFDKYIWPLKPEKLEICFATLGERAGMIGAAALALHAEKP
jgi:glucokinase